MHSQGISALISCIRDADKEDGMKVRDLIQEVSFRVLNEGNNLEREISVPYCCDLLSVAMGRMPADSAWVTVMGNVNTLAVATLADAACIILAEGSQLDEPALSKAKQQEITVFTTELSIFEAALIVYHKLHA
jgi:serine kinase of HPr protein (carbohydrate metabolism regulator)